MAWNPSPEVAVARDAAKKLGDDDVCIIIRVTKDGRMGFVSYGRTKKLCDEAGYAAHRILDYVVDHWEGWKY